MSRHRRSGICELCGQWSDNLSRHHIKKWSVFKDSDPDYIVYICRSPCHDFLEQEITKRENIILRKHFKDVYLDVFNKFKYKKAHF